MACRIDDVICVKSTEKAILVDVAGEEFWIPQSQVTEDSEVWQEGDEGTLVVTDWIAREKGLSDE
jgi:hypothetical protein